MTNELPSFDHLDTGEEYVPVRLPDISRNRNHGLAINMNHPLARGLVSCWVGTPYGCALEYDRVLSDEEFRMLYEDPLCMVRPRQ